MKYLVRLNFKAVNPLTGAVDPKRLWEVEQCKDKDNPSVSWHCESVVVGGKPIEQLIDKVRFVRNSVEASIKKQKLPEIEFYGIVYRDGQTGAIVIDSRKADASGH